MGSSSPDPEGWLPEAPNQGWIYRDRVPPSQAGLPVSAFYAVRHRHSERAVWQERLAAGEIHRDGLPLLHDAPLAAGDQLAWHRPPWIEGAVPASWAVVFDDGDLLVIDKPSGLPVLPAGGWLEHTVLRLLERRHARDPRGVPRPVHRLGRFTSGLLVCARRPATRAWLSARLRESTAAGDGPEPGQAWGACSIPGADPAPQSRLHTGAPGNKAAALPLAQDPIGPDPSGDSPPPSTAGDRFGPPSPASLPSGCRKLYRALLTPGALPLAAGESLILTTPIGRHPHPLLGRIWCAADGAEPGVLPARSTLTLLERSPMADLVAVAIASGRPHQIRIHCAAAGAPLLGDPLYGPGGRAAVDALPGDGGYRLQAWRLELELPRGEGLALEVPHPLQLADLTASAGAPGMAQ